MKISKEKLEKISEQILATLYSSSPTLLFTSNIAQEVARDEEFVKKLLNELKSKKLVKEVKKNAKGADYSKRTRWTLTEEAYSKYKKIIESR
ncbi:MAG: hypothetical protein WDZ77_00860 [Candidatus Pacearchaeota archaeon]